jgi:hypothetical protein
LVHNAYNGSLMGLNDTANSTNINISTLVLIYALDVDSTVVFKYNTHIVTGAAAISTSIYEIRLNTIMFFVVGRLIFYTCGVYSMFRVFGHNPTDISKWKLSRSTPL